MKGLEIVVVLLTTVLALTWVARRLGVSEPVLLLLGGVAIGIIPYFRTVVLPPDVVLLIFLPPLLYAESLTISLGQIRENLRVIVLPAHADRLGAPPELVDRLAEELGESARELSRRRDAPGLYAEHELRYALIAVKRTALVALRDAHRIDDAVLRRVQETLDSEETRIELRANALRVAKSADSTPPTPKDDGTRGD